MYIMQLLMLILVTAGTGAMGLPATKDKTLRADPMPDPDGNLHIYHLPIGVGEGAVIQCPDGVLSIYDLGSDPSIGHWTEADVRIFLGNYIPNIQNIVITHNHFDHYNLLPNTLNDTAELVDLQNIYISCTFNDLRPVVKEWITTIAAQDKVRTFNNGSQCGPIGGLCGTINICPNNPDITLEVLGANLGQRCFDEETSGGPNRDCIVSKITYNEFSGILPADIDDETNELDEDGPLKWLIDFYGPQLQTVYGHVAQHGSTLFANKVTWLEAISPKFITMSSDPWSSFAYPRCEVIDRHLGLQTLCKPQVTDPADPEYCGQHIMDNPPLSEILQTSYTCCLNIFDCVARTGNEYAIYTTTPDIDTRQLIDMATDGTRYGVRYEVVTV